MNLTVIFPEFSGGTQMNLLRYRLHWSALLLRIQLCNNEAQKRRFVRPTYGALWPTSEGSVLSSQQSVLTSVFTWFYENRCASFGGVHPLQLLWATSQRINNKQYTHTHLRSRYQNASAELSNYTKWEMGLRSVVCNYRLPAWWRFLVAGFIIVKWHLLVTSGMHFTDELPSK